MYTTSVSNTDIISNADAFTAQMTKNNANNYNTTNNAATSQEQS